MERIGMITVGQSPRDDLVPFMTPLFTRPVQVLEAGALDHLPLPAIRALGPDPGETGIVARLHDGSETLLSHDKILPRVQACVERLQAQGAELLVILCGADWSALISKGLVVNPGRVFPAIVSALAGGRRLGVIKPSAGQLDQARRQFAERGIEAHVTAASPYCGEARLSEARRAAESLRATRVDVVWMTCVGMDEAMREVVSGVVGTPVILARSILARIIDELIVGGRVPAAV
jgi:protein AroM